MNEHNKAAPRPWFVHDFANVVDCGHAPSFSDITISCDHPATITVASMGRGFTASMEEARAGAALIVAAVNAYDDMIQQRAELVAVLTDAAIQIENLHERFHPTGSGNQMLARIRAALAEY